MDDPPRRRALSRSTDRSPIPDGLDATLVLVRHGESRVHRRGPVPGPGRNAAVRRPAAARPRSSPTALPDHTIRRRSRCRPVRLARSSTRHCAHPPRRPTRSRPPPASGRAGRPGVPRDRPGRMGRAASRRDRARYAANARGLAPDADRGVGARAASRSPRSRTGCDRPCAMPSTPGRRRDAGIARPRPGRGLRRARRRPSPGRSSSATTACSRSHCSPCSTCRSSGSGCGRWTCARSR